MADGRLQVNDDKVKVYSSSGQKFYTVEYDQKNQAILANDNGSYWKGYLGYPAIAYLMYLKVLSYDETFANALKGIFWKKINTRNKNDFKKTEEEVNQILQEKGVDLERYFDYLDQVEKEIRNKKFVYFGKKKLPPKGD